MKIDDETAQPIANLPPEESACLDRTQRFVRPAAVAEFLFKQVGDVQESATS